MAKSDPDDHVDPPHPTDRESNPFVAFRRFADDQFNSLFHRLSDPRADPLADSSHDASQHQRWTDPRHSAWSRFESSYERATNPERRQSERRSADDPVHLVSAPSHTRDQARDPWSSDQGLVERALAAMGRTNSEQEAQRAAVAERAPRDSASHEEKHEWKRQCGHQQHGGSSFGPVSWSWSWGPWGIESETRHQPPDTQDGESQTHSQTFGPWSFGPFHIGPMTTSATFSKDAEREFQGLVSELERLGREADHASRAALHSLAQTPAPSQYGAQDDSTYSPLALNDDKHLGQRLNWCQAFEDLMAAEKGQALPNADNANQPDITQDPVQQHGSWLVRMMRRDVVDEASPWHRAMFRMNERAPAPQSSQRATAQANNEEDGPETELDYYELQELMRAKHEQEQQEQQQQQASRILSTISTVERVMLPDGSVTTKRVLRRRFADGREEEEDSTERTPPRGSHNVELEDKKGMTGGETAPKSSGGWFW